MYIDWPIGTDQERADATTYLPGNWYNSNPYMTYYEINRTTHLYNYHTGADLNLSQNGDYHSPIWAIADGKVIFQGVGGGTWGHIIVIQHKLPDGRTVYSRSAHIEKPLVKTGNTVTLGQEIAQVGNGDGNYIGAEHFHFDLSLTDTLLRFPNDWPGRDFSRVLRDYVDPVTFLIHERHPELYPVTVPYIVSATGLYMRDVPYINGSNKIGYYSRGTRVEAFYTEVVEQDGYIWRKVSVPSTGKIGWMAATVIKSGEKYLTPMK